MDALIATLTFAHDGAADEFSYSWNSTEMLLTLGGFRRYDGTLTRIDVTFSLVDTPLDFTTNRLTISYDMDSNDIKDAILTYLTTAISGCSYEVVDEVLASVELDAVLDVTYYDFQALAPELALESTGTCTFTETHTITPTPLAAVNGISSARGRLIAWDRLNAIYRSALLDPLDFTPSLSTQAAVGQAQAVRGNIILIAGYTDGYLVISTDNLVKATYSGDDYVFTYKELADYGVADPRHVGIGASQFAIYSTAGLQLVSPATGKVEMVSPVLDTYLARYTWPIQVKLLEERYICVGLPYLLDSDELLLSNRDIVPLPPISINRLIPNYPVNAGDFTTLARVLLYDIKLEKWGSCDTGVMGLFGCTPINAAGMQLGKLRLAQDQYWQTFNTGLGIIQADATIYLATHSDSSGLMDCGYIRTGPTSWCTLLDVLPEYVNTTYDPTVSITPYDVNRLPMPAARWVHPLSHSKPDVTGMLLALKISGSFDIAHLRVTCLNQGAL